MTQWQIDECRCFANDRCKMHAPKQHELTLEVLKIQRRRHRQTWNHIKCVVRDLLGLELDCIGMQ